ncbi:hypothetical protein BDN70DRAFT_570194 [Pholiota conissans]|uniref:Uncharacterized protein n=1 Tax=Pholiota conissans TaxID=109636 RepID=A0A9P5YM65_9AGAR|nr:hypothetical protein BDN70DRAFT_570194 [Pholiota conissans]
MTEYIRNVCIDFGISTLLPYNYVVWPFFLRCPIRYCDKSCQTNFGKLVLKSFIRQFTHPLRKKPFRNLLRVALRPSSQRHTRVFIDTKPLKTH